MKYRIFILPLLLGSISASAYDLKIYYDRNGECDEICSIPYVGTGCCPDQSVVTEQDIALKFMDLAASHDEEFKGFKLPDETELMDANGNLKLTGRQINAKGLDSSVTLRTTNTCAETSERNSNGICVNAQALENPEGENVAYIDWSALEPEFTSNGVLVDFSGGEVLPDDVGGNDKGGGDKICRYYRKFKVRFNWCPQTYQTFTWRWANTGTVPQGWTADEGPDLWPTNSTCNTSSVVYDYEWKNPTSLTPGNATYKQNGATVTRIDVPSGFDSNWYLRGFYILGYPEQPNGCSAGDHNTLGNDLPSGCIQYWGYRNTVAQNLVTSQNSSWGTARLGLKKGSTDMNYIPLDDTDLNNWANTRWAIWKCHDKSLGEDYQAIKPTDIIDVYAGWARKCEPGDTSATCMLQIQRTGLNQNSNKGDAMYYTSCTSGTLSGDGTYHPSCGLCSEDNPTMCSEKECNGLTNAHWCVVSGTTQCSPRSVTRACCVDVLDGCDSKGCALVGGTWEDDTSTCTVSDGDGDTGDESQEGA